MRGQLSETAGKDSHSHPRRRWPEAGRSPRDAWFLPLALQATPGAHGSELFLQNFGSSPRHCWSSRFDEVAALLLLRVAGAFGFVL